MYRIARLAELLNVTTVQIHEKLILFRSELSPHSHKENGITEINDSGLLILKHIFEAERLNAAALIYDTDSDETISSGNVSGSLSETDRRELELLNLKDRVNQNRSELHRLNMESRKLDDAISHYMNILKEDFDKRMIQEDQLEGIIRLQKQNEAESSQIGFFSGSNRK